MHAVDDTSRLHPHLYIYIYTYEVAGNQHHIYINTPSLQISTMTSISGAEEIAEELREKLAEYTLEGSWDKVVEMYKEHRKAHTVTINDSMDTALHVAVDLDEEEYVEDLVSAIIGHEEQEEKEDIDTMMMHPEKAKKLKPLEMGNERGDTPLHVAASRGFAKPCECIIGRNKERLHLSRLRNKQGDTPLFLAALNWNKQAFAYLLDTTRERIILPDLVRDNGDSILHCAIRREYFGKPPSLLAMQLHHLVRSILSHHMDFLREK